MSQGGCVEKGEGALSRWAGINFDSGQREEDGCPST
jgi:hypothetical protein